MDVPAPLVCTGPPSPRRNHPRYVRGAWFDQDAVDRVVRFAAHCRHTKGRWAGRPVEFEPWQLEYVIKPVFGWKYPLDHEDADLAGSRIVRSVWIELPRKNGKSTLASVLALYLLAADREAGAEVYAAAWDSKQARMVFDPARQMVPKSPALARRLQPFKSSIEFQATGSKFEVLTRDADTKHGLNASGVMVDEVHVHRSRDLVDTLETSTGSRTQPLVVFITTADDGDEASIYNEKRVYTERVASGTVKDPSHYGLVYAADIDVEGFDPHHPDTWKQANPNFGISVSPAYLERQSERAKASPAYLNTFLRLHLNVRTKQDVRWLPLDTLSRNVDLVIEDELTDRPCFGGLDLASTQDLTALAWVFPDDDDDTYQAIWRLWLPESRLASLNERTGDQASVWRREGWLKVTPGDVVDYRTILYQLAADARQFDVQAVAYDRWGMEFVRQQLADDGLEVAEFGQGFASMSPPTKLLERLLLEGRFAWGGNPVVRWQFGNLAVETDAAENVKLSKKKAADKIDGWVAAVMALALASDGGPSRRSVYEDRGVMSA